MLVQKNWSGRPALALPTKKRAGKDFSDPWFNTNIRLSLQELLSLTISSFVVWTALLLTVICLQCLWCYVNVVRGKLDFQALLQTLHAHL